jgi:putative nucleotidyltransferase with HDIG domain
MTVLASASRVAGATLKRALPLGLLLIWGGMLLYGERGSPPPFSEGAFLASLVFAISSLSMRLPFIAPHHLHAATLVASFLLSPWWVTPWGAADLLLLFWLALIEGTWGAKRGEGALSKKPHSIVETLLRVLEVKDPYTARHSERTATIALDIAREMGLPQTEIEALRIGALLHDIGKVGVPEAILKKDGPLSEEEWSSILAHPLIGDKLLSSAGGYFKHLDKVRDAILYHHERWDGSGYPEGLKGKEIPLVARIVAVADSYEAMTAKRCYRKAITPEEALEDICRNAGTRYDPEVVRAFVQAWEKDPAWKTQGGKTK